MQLTSSSDSVHPPSNAVLPEHFLASAVNGAFDGVVLETMYPGHCLGTGQELEQAMDIQMTLAVDVSHVHIQLGMGVMQSATWDRLQAYNNVAEVQLSSNDGRRDQHRSVDESTFGFGWATMKASQGTPLILENYMHRQPTDERRSVVALTLDAIEGWSR